MATVIASIQFPGLGRVVVEVTARNVWSLLPERTTMDNLSALFYLSMWETEAALVGIAGYKPNRARQWLLAGLGGELDRSRHRILRDTYEPEADPEGGIVSY